MHERQFSQHWGDFNHHETFFRLINPDDFSRLGIDPQDIPMGTFASEDHPSFLPSRFGGNAYGLGLVEQSVLVKSDTDFLESIDFQDIKEIGHHARRLNAIYQKLGLLIRFSETGKRYFLIPINLLAHSLQEIKTKADEVEEMIIRHIWDTRTERLDIGLLTAGHDLIVHELAARLSPHRIFLFESLDKLRSWRLSLDIVILPKDPYEYLLEQQLPRVPKRSLSRQRLFNYAMYLAGKIRDILEANGQLLVLAHSTSRHDDQSCKVRFKSDEDLKSFLLFSHIFKTRKKYEGSSDLAEMEIDISDLHYYLNRFAFFDPHLKQLLDHHKPDELSLADINRLPHLNLHMPQTSSKNPERQWRLIFETYFTTRHLKHKTPRHQNQYWQERLEIDRELPHSLLVFAGQPRQPECALASLEEDIRASGMQGCSLALVAEYRDSFRYVLDVLRILVQIRDDNFPKLSELERTRLSNPFRSRNESFDAVVRLLSQIHKLEKVRDVLNPDHIEGAVTPVLENISKLSLHGFSSTQLREILLAVVGHTTMSRIVFGKLPAKTLKPITDKAKEGNYQEILDLLRACRLMSMAEIAAALGDSFTSEQARELYRLYHDAIPVATDPTLDWEKLHDLRISAMGGVQNQAIREMLKFFNLFEFLDSWQEFIHKGRSQKEVICDYQPDKLEHLEEVLQLAGIASQFKQQFMGDYIFGHSYFFRQFLDSEFHGTGHLFPKLGTRAGFILLWIAVNSSERHIVNFNPMLAGIPQDRQQQRITKIKEVLVRIPLEMLHPGFFDEIKQALVENRPAFVFDSGIRMINNPETRAVDISFVDVNENIEQIEGLLTHFESQKLRGISLKNLQEIERLFSELESFHRYIDREGCTLWCDILGREGDQKAKDKEIEQVELRLKSILLKQIVIPEEIYDTVSVLAQHCPEVLRFILPEFHTFGNLVENWPTRKKQSLGMYVMRCLEKFQALIIKDRDNFQDRNTFYQLAKLEFGSLAEGGIGASHAQLDILEYLIDRIQQRPSLYQALSFALLFQDIGKVEQYSEAFPGAAARWTHAEQGALILESSGLLKQYHLDPLIEQLVVRLIRHHGLVGHVIQGEEPITALDQLTRDQDDRLLDVFVLHCILAAASVQEGLMIEDLLDVFLHYRGVSLDIIRTQSSWQGWLRETLRVKGEAVLADFQLTSHEAQVFSTELTRDCGFEDLDVRDEPLWHGRQNGALERLLRLVGATWVDYEDLQMYMVKMPVNFIYHKKKLKSVGPATFEKQLGTALQLLDGVSSLEPEVRCYLLYCLDDLGGSMRVYDFNPIPKFLALEESLKLLLMALQAFHWQFGSGSKGGLISFRPLSQVIERRHGTIQSLLRNLPFPTHCFDEERPFSSMQSHGGLQVQVSEHDQAIRIGYQDAVRFGTIAESLSTIWGRDELNRKFQELVGSLREELPDDTQDLEEELQKIFEEQKKRINDRTLKTVQERLNRAQIFDDLSRIQDEIQKERAEVTFSEDQQFLLKEMFEFHKSRVRDLYLDSIYQNINAIASTDDLKTYWDHLKYELLSFRSYVGKEYESLIAQFIDEKLERMEK
jgi:hypothetical protein